MAAPYIPMTPAAPVLERPVAVVGPQFCMPHPIDLSVISKTFSMTDADFAVTDINGNLVFKVKGKFFSLHDKCALLDSTGNPVVSMQQKVRFLNHNCLRSFYMHVIDLLTFFFGFRFGLHIGDGKCTGAGALRPKISCLV